jgi:hypothetical protein
LTSYAVNLPKLFKIPTILILYFFHKIKSQIKLLFMRLIFSQIKSSENDSKSDFVKSQIKLLNTLHVEHTDIHLITEVKQCWARIVLGWVNTQIKSMPGAVRSCTSSVWGWESIGDDTKRSYSACLLEISQNASIIIFDF